jgi:predicted  nucleic acid-binding Zn-ribbon protein
MREQLIGLYKIQQLDTKIRDLEGERNGHGSDLSAIERDLGQQRASIAELEAQATGLELEAKTLEATVHADNDKVKKWERRLKDIRNQREFLALSREIEGTKRAVRETEEEILAKLKAIEELTGQIDKLRDQLAEQEVDYRGARQQAQSDDAVVGERLALLSSERGGMLPGVKPALLKKYDSIRGRRLGIGITLAEDGSCVACNMKLPPQLFNMLQRVNSLEQCPSCQRLLLFAGALPN